MKTFRFYFGLTLLFLALLIYADFRGSGTMESLMEETWLADGESEFRAIAAQPLKRLEECDPEGPTEHEALDRTEVEADAATARQTPVAVERCLSRK